MAHLSLSLLEPFQATGDRLEEGVVLYGGDFLEGLAVRGCPAFEDWALLMRERLQGEVLVAFDRLVEHYAAGREVARACDAARRGVELAPWEEEAHRRWRSTRLSSLVRETEQR